MARTDLDKALTDPSSVFADPDDVLADTTLTDAEKAEILRRWEAEASGEEVALEEGMPGEESDLLRRILIALGKVAGPLDLAHTGPAKAHGLPRAALRGNKAASSDPQKE